MCSIAGFNWDDKELMRKMNSSMAHRGPDGWGIFNDNSFTLGHRRLSIIDLSKNGRQPMSDGRFILIFNGEIYNFKDLRKQLQDLGHHFQSQTDSEVLLYGYKQWGPSLLAKLNGMFAFAIFDSKTKTLFAARDRFGIKPLYYYHQNEKFIFASEIKSILTHNIPKQLNKKAAYQYLSLRYIPQEHTFYENINKVLPGHFLTFKNNTLTTTQYYDLPNNQNLKPKNAAQKVHNLLDESVQKRLVADVPVGIYLSGGLDSSAITALAAKHKKEPLQTFSVGFNYNDEVDELDKARAVAEHFQTNHHEIQLDEPIIPMLKKINHFLDMPHGDPVIIPQFKLSQLASKHVKVVLSGEGADELFAGYVQYKNMLRARKLLLHHSPMPLRKTAAKLIPIKVLDKMYDYPSSIGTKGKEKLQDFLTHQNDESRAYFDSICITSSTDRTKIHLPKVPPIPLNKERKPLLNRLLYHDIKQWLPNYPLHVADRLTMAHSIEGRVPFLDHNLAEYANSLHPSLKLKKGQTKWILRQAIKPILPQFQTKKQAFFMPLDHWFKTELKDLAKDLFSKEKVAKRGIFDYYHLKKIYTNFNQSKLIYGKQLFTLINFEMWLKENIDQLS